MTDAGTKRTSRTVAFVVGLVALAAVPALGLGAFAAADTDTGTSVTTTTAPTHTRFQLSDTQKQCLADHGATLPQRSATGERPQLSPEQRDALRAAAQACGIEFPARHVPLTDAQKQCLADHGVTLPQRSATGERPQLSPEQRDALRAAVQACGIEFPWHAPRTDQPQTI